MLEIGGRKIGGEHFALIAGPCTVESRDQTLTTAHVVAQAGATMLRGGAYKPRTSPYAFQGLGQEGLRLLAEAKEQTGLPVVTELMDARDLEPVLEVADVIQIGARNMQNYSLLSEIGRSGLPGADQARAVEHARGAAHGRRVRPQGGQRGGHPLRARDPHLRDRLPLHPRPHRGAGAQGAQPPAGHRRPQPRGGPARPRRAAEPRRRRGRAPTASSSRSTPIPRTPSATGRRRCAPRASPPTRPACRRRPRSRARPPSSALDRRGRRGGAHRRVGRPGRPRPPRRDGARVRPARRRGRRARGDPQRPPRPRRRARRRRRGLRRRARSTCSPTPWPRSSTQAPRTLRRHRRRLDQAHGRRRGARPALRRRPPAGGLGGGGRRARARGPLRRRHLVPDADRDDAGHPARAPAPPAHRARRAARGDRRRRPRPRDGRRQPPAPRRGQRPRGPGARRARRRAPAGHRPELPRRDARRRRQPGAVGRASTPPTATRWPTRSTAPSPRSRTCARSCARAPT